MKISILIILLLSLTSSSLDSPGWNATYFSSVTVQKQDTWCVHACMESGDSCGVVSPSDRFFCIEVAGISRNEITRFLSMCYSPIRGRYTTLWDFYQGLNGSKLRTCP